MARKPHLIDSFVQRLIHSVSAGSNPASGGNFIFYFLIHVLYFFWNFLFCVGNYCITRPPPFVVVVVVFVSCFCFFFLMGEGDRAC